MQEEVAVQITGDGSDLMDTVDRAEASLLSLRGVVGGLGAVLAGAGAAGFLAATNAARDYEEALVEVEKVTNPETAREMGEAIKEMAAEMPIAQRELAGIAADAGRFGIEGTANIRAFTESVARMATATDLSSQQAGEAFARLAQLTGTPVTEMENLGSSINELSNNFATSASEIVDSMLRSSAALAQFGLSQQEIVGLSASLNEVSESSERAGTRLRRLAQELMAPGKVSDLAAALGMSAEEFTRMREESPVRLIREMARAMAEGGQQADRLRSTLSTTSRQALSGLSQNLEGLDQALQMSNSSYREATSLQREYEAASSTFNAELQRTRNRLFNVAATTGSNFLPALAETLAGVNNAISTFQDFNESTDGAAGSAALAASTIGGLGLAAAAFVSGPAGLLVGAAAAIATAYATNFADIRETVNRTFSEIGSIIGRVLDDNTAKTEEELGNQVSAWQQLEAVVGGIIDTLAVGIVNLIDAFVTLADTAGASIELITGIARGDFSQEEIQARSQRIIDRPGEFLDRRGEREAAVEERNARRLAILRGERVPGAGSGDGAGETGGSGGGSSVISGADTTGARRWQQAGTTQADAASGMQMAARDFRTATEEYRQTVSGTGGGGTGTGTGTGTGVPTGQFVPSAELLGISQARYNQISRGGQITRDIPQTRDELDQWAARTDGELRPGDVGLSSEQFRRLNKGIPLRFQPGGAAGGGMGAGATGVSATQQTARSIPDSALKFGNSVDKFARAVAEFSESDQTVTIDLRDEMLRAQIEEEQQRRSERQRRATGHSSGY